MGGPFNLITNTTLSFGDSLFLRETSDGTPKSFYQHFSTGVCFDNQCRPLDIILHWSISGRYLGFEMPKGEFLSKTDHDPFSRKEYLQLSEILSDDDLPFKDIQYHELMNQPESSTESADAISGATSERIKDIVVKNAAYTTYKLWKLVYGESQKFIEQYTRKTPQYFKFDDRSQQSGSLRHRLGAHAHEGHPFFFHTLEKPVWYP